MAWAGSAGGSWGLALFLRQGLAAWMYAWPQQANRPAASAQPPPCDAPRPAGVPSSMAGQLVTVLANMVFTARQEVPA